MSANRSILFLRALPIVAACAAFSVPAEQAFATCGDWLAHPATESADAAMPIADTASRAADPQESSSHRRSPCHGPSCGRGPHAPLAPAPAPSISAGNDLACGIGLGWQSCETTRLDARTLDAANPRRGFPFGIDRPPRR
jgi:hypothetical protein